MRRTDPLLTRLGDAEVTEPAPPWRRPAAAPRGIAVGGLLGVGFATHPGTGNDLMLVTSSQGRGLFDCATGERLARDRDEDFDEGASPDLACDGIGILAGARIRCAGLFGGGLHRQTPDGWTLGVIAPHWPAERVVLTPPLQHRQPQSHDKRWQVIHDEHACELRTVGFYPSGSTIVIASSCDLTLFSRLTPPAG